MAHIADHLSVVELGLRAKTSDDACAARHYQAIWLLAQGKPLADVAATTGFVQRWLEQLASRYNQFGPDALGDRRRRNGTAPRLLTPDLLDKHRAEAGHAPGVGAVRAQADRPRSPPLRMALRHRLRGARHGREPLVRRQRRLQAALRRPAGTVRPRGRGGERRTVVLLLDGAGWHTEPGLRVPEGLRLIDLPPYTPELQPAEHLWRLVDEPIVNQHFDDITDIQERIAQRCKDLEADPDTLRANTLFHWWPQRSMPS